LKLALSHLAYVPATTRALLAQFGAPTVFKIGGNFYSVSPQEMPLESEWRGDYLLWMARRFMHYLARKPRKEWGKTMAEMEDEAVRKGLLLIAEMSFLAEEVLSHLDDMESSEIERLANGAAFHDAELKLEGELLCKMFECMVIEHGTKLSPG
jgi:hypothetical protein